MKTFKNQNGSRVRTMEEAPDGTITWCFLDQEGRPGEILTTSPEGMAKCLKEHGYQQEETGWKQD